MNKTQIFRTFSGFSLLLTLIACDTTDGSPIGKSVADIGTLIANSGPDQTVVTNQQVQLDGSASINITGDSLNYSWEFISRPDGSNSVLNDTTDSDPVFTPDLDGAYVVQLIVNDGQENSVADTVTINSTTLNIPPTANAGPDQNVTTGQPIQLDGSGSSDANGDSLTYSWVFTSRPDSSNSVLNDATLNNPTFTPDLDGTYVLQLVVNDGQVNSPADSVTINSATSNIVPISNAGPDQNVTTGQSVQLDASGSSDANGDSLTYSWVFTSRPDSSNSVLNDATLNNPTFTPDLDGTYVVQLIVNDGQENSVADTVTITSTTLNTPPVANAGPDQNVTTGQSVQLDGSDSSDANGDPLTYSWQFTARPPNSSVSLDNDSIANPIFVPDMDGTYTLSLLVGDNLLSSAADTVNILSSANPNLVSDDFAGTGELIGYTTNNPNSLPDTTRTDGRYRANLVNNAANITLHFNNFQGRLDAKLVDFPFNYIARNIGIGTQSNSQIPPPGVGELYIFAGIQVHVPELASRNSSHIVVGHRGGTYLTVEGKNTVNSSSVVNDAGLNAAPAGRADLRVVGNADRTLTIYWQLPNLSGNASNDDWTSYDLPGVQPVYGSEVYIGLITYAQGSNGVPFVGTCDAIEFNP